jgi:UDP-3-O-[3-hydroxymyristoyl] glucosamine N-acyltransferase
MSSTITFEKLAELTGGRLVRGAADGLATGLNSIADAASGDVTFLGNKKYRQALRTSQASVALVPIDFDADPEGPALIEVENPTLAFSAVIRYFRPSSAATAMGAHSTAVIDPSAHVNLDEVSIGAHVVIEGGVSIGAGSVIRAGAFIGHGTKLGEECVIHANATINERSKLGNRVTIHSNTVVGSDGFGYEFAGGKHVKIDQVGIVQIDDDVEVGSGTTIDRARFGRTWIGEGTKIDNLCQIGHNVVIGKHCIIISMVGISGSTRLGNYVTLAGQVGVAGHLELADQVVVMAQSGVSKSLLKAGAYIGSPAKPLSEGRKFMMAPAKIPEVISRVRELEAKVAELSEGS